MFVFSAHQVCVKDFMVRDLHCLTVDSTYNDAFMLIEEYGFRVYPLVDNKGQYIILMLFFLFAFIFGS